MVRSAIRPILALALMLPLVGAEGAVAKPERGAAGAERQAAQSERRVLVVVAAEPGKAGAAKRLVERLGGDVGQRLAIVHGFTARIPETSIARLRRAAAIRLVARDTRLTLSSAEPVDSDTTAATTAQTGDEPGEGATAPTIDLPPAEIPTDLPPDEVARTVIQDAAEDVAAGSSLAAEAVPAGEDGAGLQGAVVDPTAPVAPADADAPARARASMNLIRAASGATGSGLTGAGVDVALIDSGVLGVTALDGPGKLVRGPDFSVDAHDADLRGLDTFGHGSHMAGVIAGADPETGYEGIAPRARLVSVKVAGADGITSLVRVLMALDWVRRNRNSNGLRIRVLNLSFGVDARRSYVREPLAYAAEQLWNRGVAVVAAAGNQADGTGRLDLPAADPFLIAVGASDTRHTADTADDGVADFSSRDAIRPPDVVAPGTAIVSLRVPGSTLDLEFPAARVGETFFRGSGTSQAAAVVSGLVALMLEARPDLTPNQVKALLKAGAVDLPADVSADGAGRVDLARALALQTPSHADAAQPFAPAVLDLYVLWAELRDEALGRAPAVGAGENGWTGRRWSGRSWSGRSWSGRSWSGSDWGAADGS